MVSDDRVEYPTEAAPSTTTVDDETIENYRPFTLLLKKKLNDLRSAEEGQISIIYFATIQKDAGGRSTRHISKALISCVDNNGVSKQDCEDICKVFSMIKSAIVTPSIVPREDIPTFKPRELFTFRVEHFSPLLAAICGLTSKYSLPDIDRINSGEDQDHQSQFLAMVAAHDIILRGTTTYPNHFNPA